jgi:hypothetical protein
MSFEKAQQLLELATFVVARRLGVTLDESWRTIRHLQADRTAHNARGGGPFPDTESGFDEEGRKR